MNTHTRPYIAFYNGKQINIQATSSYEAQQLAAKQFKAKKVYQITVMLADIVHDTASL
jgi:hypothetical protein